jgi:hypothetical protein
MSKRKKPPTFGQPGGPGFSDLHLPGGEPLVAALSAWRRAPRDEANLGWLGNVFVVPSALARSWAVLHSVDIIHADSGSKKKPRLRGIVTLDGRQWTPTGPLITHSETNRDELDASHLCLTELLPAEIIESGIAGRLFTLEQRMDPTVCEQLGRNFYGVGPVYPKAGEEPLGLGYNVRVFPVEELELGQWFSLTVPALAAAA